MTPTVKVMHGSFSSTAIKKISWWWKVRNFIFNRAIDLELIVMDDEPKPKSYKNWTVLVAAIFAVLAFAIVQFFVVQYVASTYRQIGIQEGRDEAEKLEMKRKLDELLKDKKDDAKDQLKFERNIRKVDELQKKGEIQ